MSLTEIRPIHQILKNGIPPRDPELANEWFLKAFPNIFSDSFYDEKGIELIDSGYASLRTYLSIRKSLGKYDFRPELKNLKTKTHIIFGDSEWQPLQKKSRWS